MYAKSAKFLTAITAFTGLGAVVFLSVLKEYKMALFAFIFISGMSVLFWNLGIAYQSSADVQSPQKHWEEK